VFEHIDFLVNYGVLGLFAFAVMFALWRSGRVIGNKFFGNGGKPGYVERYLNTQKAFLDGITDRDIKQIGLCKMHQEKLALLTAHVTKHDEAAAKAIAAIHVIAEIHRKTDFSTSIKDVLHNIDKMNRIYLLICNICDSLSEKLMDDDRKIVEKALKEIQKILQETR
jgi:hypothetical protein